MSDEVVELLNAVLNMQPGEVHVLREDHIPPSRIHFYRDGWYVLVDFQRDTVPCNGRAIGWYFKYREDICEFLLCSMGKRVLNFVIRGTGQ